MSDARFWFDKLDPTHADRYAKGDHRFPHKVVEMLKNAAEVTWPHMWKIYDGRLNSNHLEFDKEYALFMRGTTSELLKALKLDTEKGIDFVAVRKENFLDIRYFRQKVSSTKTVTVIGLAARDGYWGIIGAENRHDAAEHKGWAQLELLKNSEKLTLPRGGANVIFSGVTVAHLAKLVQTCQGVEPWF